MSVLADEFTQVFREEHRAIRDLLLELIDAFRAADRPRIESLLREMAAATGPHFRYEEEALYPSLVTIFGAEYVEQLLGDHDRAIGTARRLVELAGRVPLTSSEAEQATSLVRTILPHVSDCDGLSVMVEVLPEAQVRSIFDARSRSLRENLDLFAWADSVRERPRAH